MQFTEVKENWVWELCRQAMHWKLEQLYTLSLVGKLLSSKLQCAETTQCAFYFATLNRKWKILFHCKSWNFKVEGRSRATLTNISTSTQHSFDVKKLNVLSKGVSFGGLPCAYVFLKLLLSGEELNESRKCELRRLH